MAKFRPIWSHCKESRQHDDEEEGVGAPNTAGMLITNVLKTVIGIQHRLRLLLQNTTKSRMHCGESFFGQPWFVVV
jgi:hypothetical protein